MDRKKLVPCQIFLKISIDRSHRTIIPCFVFPHFNKIETFNLDQMSYLYKLFKDVFMDFKILVILIA